MKVLIPAAGLGTRLRPHTYHRPKPLVHVAGSTVLGHVLDKLEGLDVEEIIFVIGHLGEQIESYVAANYSFRCRFVVQSELKGQAHAIWLARDGLDGPLLILFVDTIFEADLGGLEATGADGVIYVSEVDDPRRFGIVLVGADGFIERLEEKPKTPRSKLAIAGLYFLQDGSRLLAAIDDLMVRDIQTKGEFYLADALQLMIDDGARFVTRSLAVWEDCGTREALLRANRYLLGKLVASPLAALPPEVVIRQPVHIGTGTQISGAVIGPYVHIGDECRIESSVIGPYVSLAHGARVNGSLLTDVIVDVDAEIARMALAGSLIGAGVRVRGRHERLNVGDSSEVDLTGAEEIATW
jgi:glucose-1-phosphate thymidylyltransferase